MKKTAIIRHLETQWMEFSKEKNEILFFIHGFPDQPEVWTHQFEYFKKKYHIIAPYLRGSEIEPYEIPHQRFELDSILLDFLKILKISDPTYQKPIHIICHDIGGPLGWELASLLGKRCHSLTAINAPSFMMLKKLFTHSRQLLKSSYIAFFQIPYLSDIFIPGNKKKMLQYYRKGLRVLLSQKKFKKLNCPVRIIWGHADPFLNIPSNECISESAHQFQIKVLRGGHWLQKTQSENINRIIDQFLLDQMENRTHVEL